MEQQIDIKQRPSRAGQNNPMWGKKQSDEARRKQSEAMKKRHQQYRQWKNSQEHITMDEFLGSKPIREYISSIIREEIEKLL